jgi:Ribbon-helix-helix domain
MDKARKPTYIWSSTFEVLKDLNQQTHKPMTELLDEAVMLLAKKYGVQQSRKG